MGKINVRDRILIENQERKEKYGIQRTFFTQISHLLEWNSQTAKSSWCQRERWHHLPYV